VDPNVFRQVIGNFASGVTVITTREEDTNYGLTASAVTSLTLEPPMLLVCINKNTGTQAAISRTRKFGVNILGQEQAPLAYQFAKPQSDKFQGVDVSYGGLGVPLLTDALARIECRVAADVEAGTHKVFLAEVDSAETSGEAPLTYFRGKFGRFEMVQDEAVYQQIRDHVLSRSLAIADTLDPTKLASQFNAPISSVYYGLTKLTSEGLASLDRVKGYVINPIDAKISDDSFDARCAIELGAAELSVGRLSEHELAELRKRMEATLPLVSGNRFVDFERYVEENTAFHEYLVSLAKSSALLDAYRRLSFDGIMWRIIWRTIPVFDQASEELTADHRRIVEAYEKGDKELAKQAIVTHTEHSKLTNRKAIEAAGGLV
jgi:flavin reductase (DIM6/NTAB) family NADH-FMN oxidoreductase RutF/DNA-binding GntR family transcriptional regulator